MAEEVKDPSQQTSEAEESMEKAALLSFGCLL